MLRRYIDVLQVDGRMLQVYVPGRLRRESSPWRRSDVAESGEGPGA